MIFWSDWIASAAQHPYAIVLREKDLSESEYEALARDCLRICQKHAVPLNLNSQIAVARRIGCDGIHLPFHLLLQHKNELDVGPSRVGVSLHSPEEAAQLADTPATYVQAGHVFPTRLQGRRSAARFVILACGLSGH